MFGLWAGWCGGGDAGPRKARRSKLATRSALGRNAGILDLDRRRHGCARASWRGGRSGGWFRFCGCGLARRRERRGIERLISLALNARRLFHWAAVALTVGAVVGMYARGLVFEYNVVWRSTFIRQPEMVVWILRCLLGPASILLGIPFPSEDDATALMTPAGAPAAIWIHLYATSAVALVVVPRTMLAIGAGIRRRAITSRLQLDMSDEYYRELIDVARTRQMKLVAEAIDTDVRAASAGFSEAVATFVCERLYDARIIPKLQDFRHRGGRLADLEEAIRADCESFQPELSRYLPVAQHDFERSLAGRIERTIGTELKVIPVPGSGLTNRVGEVSGGSVQDVGWSLGRGLADVIGVTLSGAVAVSG
jgi:hypothetical protein